MAVSEKRGAARDAKPQAPARRGIGIGLSPTVERLFGALVKDQDTAEAQPAPEPEAQSPTRPGAA